jgi:hypothetical protein
MFLPANAALAIPMEILLPLIVQSHFSERSLRNVQRNNLLRAGQFQLTESIDVHDAVLSQ